eukprot:363517-Chlamydomonas_euryale.AAC.3
MAATSHPPPDPIARSSTLSPWPPPTAVHPQPKSYGSRSSAPTTPTCAGSLAWAGGRMAPCK